MEWLLAHLVGTFILQSDATATKRRSSTPWCVLYTLLYLLPFVSLYAVGEAVKAPLQLAAMGFMAFILARWPVAGGWMSMSGKDDFRRGIFAPWSSVVVDQTLHLCAIYAILRWVG
jgi:hypothetical protein